MRDLLPHEFGGLLGHYSTAFTLDTYGHITPAMKQDTADKVGGS